MISVSAFQQLQLMTKNTPCLAKQHIPNRHVAVLFQRFLPVVARFIECWHLGMTNTTKSQLSFRGFRVSLCFLPPAWGGICPPAQLLQVAQLVARHFLLGPAPPCVFFFGGRPKTYYKKYNVFDFLFLLLVVFIFS